MRSIHDEIRRARELLYLCPHYHLALPFHGGRPCREAWRLLQVFDRLADRQDVIDDYEWWRAIKLQAGALDSARILYEERYCYRDGRYHAPKARRRA